MQKLTHPETETSSRLTSDVVDEQTSRISESLVVQHQGKSEFDKARLLAMILIPLMGLLQLMLVYPLGVVGYLLIAMGLMVGLAGYFTATRIYRNVIRFGLPVVAVLSLTCGFVTVTNPSEEWVNDPRWLVSRGAKMWEPNLNEAREASETFAWSQRMFTDNIPHPRIKSTAGWLAPGPATRVSKTPQMVRVETRAMAERLWKENADAHARHHEQQVSGAWRLYSAFADALEAGIFQVKPALDNLMLWVLVIAATAVGDLLAGTLRVLRRRQN